MIMTEKLPIITVTCYRDLALLDIQAQSVSLYLSTNCPVYLVVNEEHPEKWDEYFNTHLRHYYSKHNLTILYRSDFDGEWRQWIPSPINPWAVGWETQQVLKLAVADKVKSIGYLILDSQNFLIKTWDPNSYDFSQNKIPYRTGYYTMPAEIWKQYSESLDVNIPLPKTHLVSMCTPFFMHTDLVSSIIRLKGGLLKFTEWFKRASKTKSEFILYAVWAEKNGGIEKWHYHVPSVDDWANPYLRDSKTFNDDFKEFIKFIGVHEPHRWISINHRSWGDMSYEQYTILKDKLLEYNLIPNFDEYRSTYVDIKI
jgi:hypothetical protein